MEYQEALSYAKPYLRSIDCIRIPKGSQFDIKDMQSFIDELDIKKHIIGPVSITEENLLSWFPNHPQVHYIGEELMAEVNQKMGVVVGDKLFFGWRDNQFQATMFETRTTAEVQYLPVQLGILHLGLYGGIGFARRFEDAVKLAGDHVVAGDDSSGAFAGGTMLQLDINTRVALTARLGLAWAHGEQMSDAIIGVSVY